MPYIFSPPSTPHGLMQRCHQSRGWGQIIGPHGTGKSTLVHWLARQLEKMSKPVLLISVPPSPLRVPFPWAHWRDAKSPLQLIIDGFEQLAWWRRAWLIRQCRRRNVPLLVTAHRSFGFPTLMRTHVTLGVAQAIVARLLAAHLAATLPDDPPAQSTPPDLREPITLAAIEREWTRHGGNMRETLFSLYDEYEQTRRVSGCGSLTYASDESP